MSILKHEPKREDFLTEDGNVHFNKVFDSENRLFEELNISAEHFPRLAFEYDLIRRLYLARSHIISDRGGKYAKVDLLIEMWALFEKARELNYERRKP